jgi:hypothetical protein
MIVKAYPDYDAYKKRTDRDIPVLICKTVDWLGNYFFM